MLAIEAGFVLTLNETGNGLVLTMSETGLTFGEPCSRSRAAGADYPIRKARVVSCLGPAPGQQNESFPARGPGRPKGSPSCVRGR